MKNISRRVFIKGLAVAGVAAAASTVLAGCNTNMIPDIDNGDEGGDETSASNVLTLTSKADSSKTFTLDFGKLELGSAAFGNEKAAVVRVNLTNSLGMDTVINPDATDAKGADVGDYFVLVSAYKNDLSGNEVVLKYYTVGTTTGDLESVAITEGSDSKRLVVDDITGINSLTVKAILNRCVFANSSDASKVAYEEMDSKTYTFKL